MVIWKWNIYNCLQSLNLPSAFWTSSIILKYAHWGSNTISQNLRTLHNYNQSIVGVLINLMHKIYPLFFFISVIYYFSLLWNGQTLENIVKPHLLKAAITKESNACNCKDILIRTQWIELKLGCLYKLDEFSCDFALDK